MKPKKVVIIHGWSGRPDCGWFQWIYKELQKRNMKVTLLEMPNKDYPKIKEWVSFLEKNLKNPDKDTILIGHSIGCQTILRYLEKTNKKVGKAIFVAGWITLSPLETAEEKKVASPWLKTPIAFKKIKKLTKYTAIFSNNDPYVPNENHEFFKELLGAKVIVEKNKGHYIEDKTLKIPILLKEIIEGD